MALGHGKLPVVKQFLPSVVGVVFTREDWKTISYLSAKHSQRRGAPGDWVQCVPVRHDGPMEAVHVQRAILTGIVRDYPLDLLDPKLCPAV